MISETKLDNSFPRSQFRLPGYTALRLDRTANGGGLLFYLRDDIPVKLLPLLFGDIECLILDITISKKKWLLAGTYNSNKSKISEHLSLLGKNLCHYLTLYDNIIITGDFNSEIKEEAMSDFCNLFNLASLIKTPTCFKSIANPSCIDLILTNRQHNFQNSTIVETGLSDFHKLVVTVMKTSFRKKPPKVIKYRNFKQFSQIHFRNEFNHFLLGIDLKQISNDNYVSLFMEIFNRHAPLKSKYVRANDQPFMTKDLRKEHMKRTRLRNKYLKDKTEASNIAYKKQRNKCVSPLKKTKNTYFENLNPSAICDNKRFWKTVKPLFSEQSVSTDTITLIENNEIIVDNSKIAEIFNDFFSNAIKNLNIESYDLFSFDEYFLNDKNIDLWPDPILEAIKKYKNHPSVKD